MMLAIALVLDVAFAHGGACAAMELAELATHGAPPGLSAAEPADHDELCQHRSLPEDHRHGTERDCSAIGPADLPTFVAMPATLSIASVTGGVEAPPRRAAQARPAAPCRANLCVMRI
ncbi:hypothetical protein ACIBG4_25505 [Nonomuraea sp. NPDC050383]|uniref:hypothetical protein n=1 Tax=Nonomuraea sp. NPDC050383 TaxID=3364362 RepID=UPI00379AEEE7